MLAAADANNIRNSGNARRNGAIVNRLHDFAPCRTNERAAQSPHFDVRVGTPSLRLGAAAP
jgi:hypothetical protein